MVVHCMYIPHFLNWTIIALNVMLVSPIQQSEADIYRYRAAQLASIRQMSRQVSRGSPGEYQADEQAGVARLRWRVSRISHVISA